MDKLKTRELQIAELVREGLDNKEIAARLRLRPSTVSSMLREIHRLLGIHRRTELAVAYERRFPTRLAA
jgi:DNA-binding NarL/FixJ family response regulator